MALFKRGEEPAKVLEVELDTEELLPSDSVGSTRAWAMTLHGGQKDKMGLPYVDHLDAVALNLYTLVGFDAEHLMIAYLHDVMEDCHVTETDLWVNGYTDRVIDAVIAITKKNNEPNPDYISRVLDAGADAMLVKLADLYNNTETWRLEPLVPAVQDRLKKKYYPAIWRIETALIDMGFDLDPTITFEEAREACDAKLMVSGNPWRVKIGGFDGVFPGDSVRLAEGAPEFKIKKKKITALGNLSITTEESDVEIVFEKGVPFQLKWGTGAWSAATPWTKYMGLPADWKDGDPLP